MRAAGLHSQQILYSIRAAAAEGNLRMASDGGERSFVPVPGSPQAEVFRKAARALIAQGVA